VRFSPSTASCCVVDLDPHHFAGPGFKAFFIESIRVQDPTCCCDYFDLLSSWISWQVSPYHLRRHENRKSSELSEWSTEGSGSGSTSNWNVRPWSAKKAGSAALGSWLHFSIMQSISYPTAPQYVQCVLLNSRIFTCLLVLSMNLSAQKWFKNAVSFMCSFQQIVQRSEKTTCSPISGNMESTEVGCSNPPPPRGRRLSGIGFYYGGIPCGEFLWNSGKILN
jgi:hypothetical protein